MVKIVGTTHVTKDYMITIPKEAREYLNIGPKDHVCFEVLKDGTIRFYKITPQEKT